MSMRSFQCFSPFIFTSRFQFIIKFNSCHYILPAQLLLVKYSYNTVMPFPQYFSLPISFWFTLCAKQFIKNTFHCKKCLPNNQLMSNPQKTSTLPHFLYCEADSNENFTLAAPMPPMFLVNHQTTYPLDDPNHGP